MLFDQVNRFGGAGFLENSNGVIVAFGVFIIEITANRNIHVGCNDEIEIDFIHQDVERIYRSLLFENLLAEQLDPVAFVLEHGGIFLIQAIGNCLLIVTHVFIPGVEKVLDLLGQVLPDIIGVKLFVFLLGRNCRFNGDPRVFIQVNIGVQAVLINVGENAPPFPDSTTAGIDGNTNLLLKITCDPDNDFAFFAGADLNFNTDLQSQAQTFQAFEVDQSFVDGCFDFGDFHFDLATRHQLHVPRRQGGAIVQDNVVTSQIKVALQGGEFFGFQGQGSQISGRFFGKSALSGLLLDAVFQIGRIHAFE